MWDLINQIKELKEEKEFVKFINENFDLKI